VSCVSLPGPIAARVAALAKHHGQTRRQVVVDLIRRSLEAEPVVQVDHVVETAAVDCNLATVGA
jgi:hypothetical protein